MCISIGLTIGKVPVVGVVYNPIMNEVKNSCLLCLQSIIFVVKCYMFLI